MQEENLAVVEIEVESMAVETDLGGGSTEVVVKMVAFVTDTIKVGHKVVEELIVFI